MASSQAEVHEFDQTVQEVESWQYHTDPLHFGSRGVSSSCLPPGAKVASQAFLSA